MLSTGAGEMAAGSAAGPALLPVYAQMPVVPVSGHGSWLTDAEGNEWLDAYGGHAVSSTGHSHPDVVRAICDQAGRLLFYSAAVHLQVRERLAEALVARSPAPLDRVFLCNSGAEANENALHLARRATGRRTIVSVEGGWHGRTVAALACTDGAKYAAWAEGAGMPLSRKVPFDDVAALERAVDDSVAALIVEPVQGMSGARDVSPHFLRAARALCDRHGAALVFDEVQCGVGRCGAFTAAESFGVVPDALTMAKGLASGLPAAAVLAAPSLTSRVQVGDLGTTFGGGPVTCAAALATLDVIEREDLVGNAIRVGRYITERAQQLGVRKVSGRGLLLGLHLDRAASDVQRALFGRRILTGTSADPAVLRLLPPLTFTTGDADLLLAGLAEVLQ